MVVHFSCGAASAVASLIALHESPEPVELLYADPGLEHPDNHRFMRDFESKFNVRITVVRSSKYTTPFEVFEAYRYLSGPAGAPCTKELKKIPIRDYLGTRLLEEVSVFGYTNSKREINRSERYRLNNPEVPLYFPLIEHDLSKKDCYYIIDYLGLTLPKMYRLGYSNANCTGCVKANSLSYWAAIRQDFPETFNWYAKFERSIGAKDPNTGERRGGSINRRRTKGESIRVFLDELPEDIEPSRNISFTCGYSCGAQDMDIEVVQELTGDPSPQAEALALALAKTFNTSKK